MSNNTAKSDGESSNLGLEQKIRRRNPSINLRSPGPLAILVAATLSLGIGTVLLIRPVVIGPRAPTEAWPSSRQVQTNVSSFTNAPVTNAAMAPTYPGPEKRVEQVLARLDSGQDASTGLGFEIGQDGKLVRAPTRRVGLLDELARLDPKAAGAYAEKVLRDFGSADEWAISLRNCALANPTTEGKAFLEQKLLAMLQHQEWQRNPSAGFLEAFDVAVYLGGTNLMPSLGALVRLTNNPAVSFAAFLALDRLTINDPVATLTKLQNEPGLMEGREVTRANYFARANVSDPKQRTLLETYLLNPALSQSELSTFAGLFPNANYFVRSGQLTRPVTSDGAVGVHRDCAALNAVDEWLADSRFARLDPQLRTMKQRLAVFVAEARESEP